MSDRDDDARSAPNDTDGQPTPQPRNQADAPPERPQETFKRGVGLLWQAARAAADEIKREVEKGGVTESIQQAGRDLEDAATMAAKALEGFIERAGVTPAKGGDKGWPPPDATAEGDDAKKDDDGDGKPGDDGDVRIQVD